MFPRGRALVWHLGVNPGKLRQHFDLSHPPISPGLQEAGPPRAPGPQATARALRRTDRDRGRVMQPGALGKSEEPRGSAGYPGQGGQRAEAREELCAHPRVPGATCTAELSCSRVMLSASGLQSPAVASWSWEHGAL